jgi:hypothetical protein
MTHSSNGKPRPTVSRRLRGGVLVELLYVAESKSTKLAVHDAGTVQVVDHFEGEGGERLVPIQASNNLIRHNAVVLPAAADPYSSIAQLIADIQAYLHRYVDLSDQFEKIASYYVLLTWVYDAFNELPYLRLRGDFGSGKSRALIVVGSLCYKAFFASGASTVSPIFHTLDTFRGTLIFDEADFRFSDEKSELVKIFNNGNAKGFPVLRTAMTLKKEFDPRAFIVYGPKIVAMRRSFEDRALESRFLTEEMGQRPLRAGIPINLPDRQKDEALALRNQLLSYRFQVLERVHVDETLADPSLSPRLNQILIPLLSIVEDPELRDEIRASMSGADQALYAERSASSEARVLEVLADLMQSTDRTTVAISDVAALLASRFHKEYDRPITNRYVGGVLRERLRLVTYKSHGVYVVPVTEKPKVDQLCLRYGVTERQAESA